MRALRFAVYFTFVTVAFATIIVLARGASVIAQFERGQIWVILFLSVLIAFKIGLVVERFVEKRTRDEQS